MANIKLSGEPFVPEVADGFPNGGAGTPTGLLEYENITVQLEQYRSVYHNCWEPGTDRVGKAGRIDRTGRAGRAARTARTDRAAGQIGQAGQIE